MPPSLMTKLQTENTQKILGLEDSSKSVKKIWATYTIGSSPVWTTGCGRIDMSIVQAVRDIFWHSLYHPGTSCCAGITVKMCSWMNFPSLLTHVEIHYLLAWIFCCNAQQVLERKDPSYLSSTAQASYENRRNRIVTP